MRRLFLLASILALASPMSVIAQSVPAASLPTYSKTLAELNAISPTGGAGGSGNSKVQVVTILGDPSKPGVYSQLLKVAPNAAISAHHHAGDRVGTVLEGTWHFGYGDEFDKTKLKTLPVGSVYTEPSEAPHFAMTGNEAVVVLITGTGPTDTVYENPADDPTTKK
ncbi:cupin domain-containing protein [Paraburkholderia strydomiana]|uniref:cupin domain-containing protein n=2 Tax=Paraburkholderia strydomiana TaxID=1245417 RepID=UPI0038BD0423